MDRSVAYKDLSPEVMRASTIVWLVVNTVNFLQAVGFATRPFAPGVNPALGLVMAALALPASWALTVLLRSKGDWLLLSGPLAFDAFVVFMLAVERFAKIQWRDPMMPSVQIPYLVLFFGSILLMGLPMFHIDRRRWAVTVLTTVVLLGSMLYATSQGVG